jgi:2-polyprenyl-3-methyl-5-hydroxy-6-metoxy-1,4-benzoquinol methylase
MSQIKTRAADLHKNVPPDWYKKSIEENALQRFWHLTRFKQVGKMVEPTKGSILDVGSADGTFTKIIVERSKAKKVIGIDVLESSVNYSKKRFAKSRVMSFRMADAHNLPFKDKQFDAVFCLETLEHVEDPIKVVSEMGRVLTDEGYLVILVPAENLLFRMLWPIWLLGKGRIWRGTHLNHFSSDQVLDVIRKNGFEIVENNKFLWGMLQAAKARKVKKGKRK